jgi:hypothetical protein
MKNATLHSRVCVARLEGRSSAVVSLPRPQSMKIPEEKQEIIHHPKINAFHPEIPVRKSNALY